MCRKIDIDPTGIGFVNLRAIHALIMLGKMRATGTPAKRSLSRDGSRVITGFRRAG